MMAILTASGTSGGNGAVSKARQRSQHPSPVSHGSEDQLQSELHLPRSSSGEDLSRARFSNGCVGCAEVHIVRGIKCLPPELQVGSLAEYKILQERRVQALRRRCIHDVHAGVAIGVC